MKKDMFLKVKNCLTNQETIINTEQIININCSIVEAEKYEVKLSNNTVRVSKEDAQKIFNAIGVSL